MGGVSNLVTTCRVAIVALVILASCSALAAPSDENNNSKSIISKKEDLLALASTSSADASASASAFARDRDLLDRDTEDDRDRDRVRERGRDRGRGRDLIDNKDRDDLDLDQQQRDVPRKKGSLMGDSVDRATSMGSSTNNKKDLVVDSNPPDLDNRDRDRNRNRDRDRDDYQSRGRGRGWFSHRRDRYEDQDEDSGRDNQEDDGQQERASGRRRFRGGHLRRNRCRRCDEDEELDDDRGPQDAPFSSMFEPMFDMIRRMPGYASDGLAAATSASSFGDGLSRSTGSTITDGKVRGFISETGRDGRTRTRYIGDDDDD